MAHVLQGLEAAFASFDGVPSELLFDQMKAVIVRNERDAGGRITENAEFLRFGRSHRTPISTLRPSTGSIRWPTCASTGRSRSALSIASSGS